MQLLSRVWTALGALCVAATLLLGLPGAVRVVRADDRAPVLSSQDPLLEAASAALAATESPPASPLLSAPGCSAATEAPPPLSLQEQIAAHAQYIRAAGSGSAESDVIVLNGRGYNYGSGDPRAAAEQIELERALQRQER